VKITNLSLVAIAAVAMTTGAMAEIDLKTTGQAVVYYQTVENGGDTDFFAQGNSSANAGFQLNVNGDLGNGFGLGLQGTALGTLGLENNLVSSTMQKADGTLNGAALTKAYITKQLGNTTLKAGRQELPKSLSPLAFSESWNVFKNTFDAVVAINTDIPDTTVVGAYVSKSNNHGDLGSFDNMGANSPYGKQSGSLNSGAYMLTVANKSSKVVQPTLTYYALKDINVNTGKAIIGGDSGDAYWADVQVAADQLPVKLGLQGGQIDPSNGLDTTTTYGAKVTGKANNVNLKLAYSTVDEGPVSVQNVGTGVKTPLYTQMIGNQNFISSDADTVVLQAAMPLAAGKMIAQYGMTTDNSDAGNDYNELDLIYKFKAFGTDMLAAYVMQKADNNTFACSTDTAGVKTCNDDTNNIIRVWTRYNF
jgi:hypothetical protein